MKITDIRLITLELPEGGGPERIPQLVQVPGLHRIQYRAGVNPEREPILKAPAKPREHVVEVRTDQGITGRVPASTMDAYHVDLVRSMAWRDPLHRGGSTRCSQGDPLGGQKPAGSGLHNCLWDIAARGRAARAHPDGGARPLPCYLTAATWTQRLLRAHRRAREKGGSAPTSSHYKGGKADFLCSRRCATQRPDLT